MEQLLVDLKPAVILSSLIYSAIGMVIFGIAFFIFTKVVPFSVRKEIEEDQNIALGIIVGSFLVGLAIIIASAIH